MIVRNKREYDFIKFVPQPPRKRTGPSRQSIICERREWVNGFAELLQRKARRRYTGHTRAPHILIVCGDNHPPKNKQIPIKIELYQEGISPEDIQALDRIFDEEIPTALTEWNDKWYDFCSE